MSMKVAKGGVITGFGTNLFSKLNVATSFPVNQTPKTVFFKNGPAAEKIKLFGLKSFRQPKLHTKNYVSAGFDVSQNFNKFNLFQGMGFQQNKRVMSMNSLDLFQRQRRSERSFSTATAKTSTVDGKGVVSEITVFKDQDSSDSHKIVLPLSNGQKCMFTIDNQTTLKNFIAMVKEEDSTISNISISSADGVRHAGTTKLSEILSSPFVLSVNGKKISVSPSSSNVNTITSALNPNLSQNFDQIYNQIVPLSVRKHEIDSASERKANFAMYVGLGFLVAQWSFLARLTWWEFNWDIMEPVTYFVTFGTAVLGYFYFAVTRREYTFQDVRENILRNSQFKSYIKKDFPIEEYYALEHQLKSLNPEAFEKLQWELNEGLLKLKDEKAK